MIRSKAEEYIEAHRLKGSYPEGDFDVWRAYEVIEIAIGEIVEKAGAIFCSEHCFVGCPYTDKDCCGVLRRFKQKLVGDRGIDAEVQAKANRGVKK